MSEEMDCARWARHNRHMKRRSESSSRTTGDAGRPHQGGRNRSALPARAAGQPGWLGWLPPHVFTRLREYMRLTRLDRPVGWLLLLWPTWWALWLAAESWPSASLLAIFSLGVVLTRSAGCVVNDYTDRWLDRSVARTRERPLVSGTVGAREALMLFAVLMSAAFGLVLLTNRLTVMLSGVALVLAVAYPFMKRVLWTPQVVLGLAFGMGIPMAFAATQGRVPVIAWLLLIANVFWTVAYDTYYAIVDREDDLAMGAKSSAILFGDADLVAIAVSQGMFLLGMALVGDRAGLGMPYWIGWTLALAIAAWCHYIARSRFPADCLRAFRLNHWVGAALWLGIATHYAFR